MIWFSILLLHRPSIYRTCILFSMVTVNFQTFTLGPLWLPCYGIFLCLMYLYACYVKGGVLGGCVGGGEVVGVAVGDVYVVCWWLQPLVVAPFPPTVPAQLATTWFGSRYVVFPSGKYLFNVSVSTSVHLCPLILACSIINHYCWLNADASI